MQECVALHWWRHNTNNISPPLQLSWTEVTESVLFEILGTRKRVRALNAIQGFLLASFVLLQVYAEIVSSRTYITAQVALKAVAVNSDHVLAQTVAAIAWEQAIGHVAHKAHFFIVPGHVPPKNTRIQADEFTVRTDAVQENTIPLRRVHLGVRFHQAYCFERRAAVVAIVSERVRF
jgi:hypothetical protein